MTKAPTVGDALAQLQKELDEMLNPLDIPRTWTGRELNAYEEKRAALEARIRTIRTAAATLAALPSIEPDTKWRDFQTTARQTIDAELLAMHPRNDRELEQQQRLRFCIRLIDFGLAIGDAIGPIIDLSSTRIGELMAAAGYATDGRGLYGPNGFRGSLPETEQRIKTLTEQRADAQASLDALLITNEERAKREIEDKAFHATLNTMDLKNNSTGTGLVAYTKDGDPLDVKDMTPAQRKAFERFARTSVSHSPLEAVTS